MSDEAALLAAIRDNPNEDTPRLVYADWLDEHATTDAQRARAELIRVNSEVLRLNGEFQAPECTEYWRRLVNRQAELVERYQQQWFSAFPFLEVTNLSQFWCGFLQNIDLTCQQCSAFPRPPWEREPRLGVNLTGTTAELCEVIESDWLTGVESLHLNQHQGTDGDALARAIVASPCAASLRWLRIHNVSLSDSGVHAIGESLRFPRLTTLMLGGNFGTEGWAAVVNGPIADRLISLNFTHLAWDTERRPGPEAAAILAASSRLNELKELWITRTRLGGEGAGRAHYERLTV